MKPWSFARSLPILVAATLLMTGSVSAADVHVMISAGFFGVYSELGPAFERATGHRLVTTRGPSMGDSPEAIPTRLARGEPAAAAARRPRRCRRPGRQRRRRTGAPRPGAWRQQGGTGALAGGHGGAR